MLAAQVVEQGFERPMFVTLTVDQKAFAGRELDLLDHLRAKRAVGETLRALKKRGLIGPKHYTAMEFQENGMPHFHIIVDSLVKNTREPKLGYLDAHLVQEIWGRKRPKWAGPRQPFGPGTKTPDKLRPGLGMVDVRPIINPKEVIAYVTAYVGKPGKNPVPEWFIEYCGSEKNAVLKMPSKGFFEGVKIRKPRSQRKRPGAKRRRRHCRERLESCRTETVILKYVETTRNGELVGKPNVEYLGKFSREMPYWAICCSLLGEELGARKAKQRGFQIENEDLQFLLAQPTLAGSIQGFGSIQRDTKSPSEAEESETDLREIQQPDSDIWNWAKVGCVGTRAPEAAASSTERSGPKRWRKWSQVTDRPSVILDLVSEGKSPEDWRRRWIALKLPV